MALEHVADSINKIVERDIEIKNRKNDKTDKLKEWAAKGGISWDASFDKMDNDTLQNAISDRMQLKSHEDYYYQNNFNMPEGYKNVTDIKQKTEMLRVGIGRAKEIKTAKNSILSLGYGIPEYMQNDPEKLLRYSRSIADFKSGIFSKDYEEFQNEILDNESKNITDTLKMNDENNIFNNYFNEKFKNEKYPNAAFIKSLYKDGQGNVESALQEYISWAGSKGMTINNNMVDNLRSQLTKNQNPVQIWENQKKNIENKMLKDKERKQREWEINAGVLQKQNQIFDIVYNGGKSELLDEDILAFGIEDKKIKDEIQNNFKMFKIEKDKSKNMNIVNTFIKLMDPEDVAGFIKNINDGKEVTTEQITEAMNKKEATEILNQTNGILDLSKYKSQNINQTEEFKYDNTMVGNLNSKIHELIKEKTKILNNSDIYEFMENNNINILDRKVLKNSDTLKSIKNLIEQKNQKIKYIDLQISDYRKSLDEAQQDERFQYTQSEKIKNKIEKEKDEQEKKNDDIKKQINKLKLKLANQDIENTEKTEIEKQIRELNMQLSGQKTKNVIYKKFKIIQASDIDKSGKKIKNNTVNIKVDGKIIASIPKTGVKYSLKNYGYNVEVYWDKNQNKLVYNQTKKDGGF